MTLRVVLAVLAMMLATSACGGGGDDGGGNVEDDSTVNGEESAEPSPEEDAESSGEEDADGMRVSADDYGDDWPLTVSSGTLDCQREAVTFTTQGTTYAVNGMAESHDLGVDIEPIWADNPEIPGTKKNIGPLIDDGLELCK